MSTPIAPTPKLKGKEAEKFLKQVDDKNIQPAPKEEVLKGKAAYEALMPECPCLYRDDCANHLLSPRELYKLLSMSEIRIRCPHCSFITYWNGRKELPIQCRHCGRYFLEANKPEAPHPPLTDM